MTDDDDDRPRPAWQLVGEQIIGLQTAIAVVVSLLDDRGAIRRTEVAEALREVAQGQRDRGARVAADSVEYIAEILEGFEAALEGRPVAKGRPSLRVVKPDDDDGSGKPTA